MRELPKKTKLFRLAVNQQPNFWTLADFGPWPAKGGAIYGIEFPSANRSNTTKYGKYYLQSSIDYCTLTKTFFL